MAGGGKGGGQSSEVKLDPQTKRFVEQQLRPQATNAARVATQTGQPFFNPATAQQQQAAGAVGDLQQNQLQGLFSGAGQAVQNLGFAGQQGLNSDFLQQFTQNPASQGVRDDIRANIDQQAELAARNAAQRATQAGAFGGSRSDITQALGEAGVRAQGLQQLNQFDQSQLNRGQDFQLQQQGLAANLGLGGLRAFGQGIGLGGGLAGQQFGMGEGFRQIQNQQSQEPLFRQQQALGFLNQGLGAFGQQGSAQQQGSLLGGAAGGAIAGSAFGPIGAGIGGGIGLLGGLF